MGVDWVLVEFGPVVPPGSVSVVAAKCVIRSRGPRDGEKWDFSGRFLQLRWVFGVFELEIFAWMSFGFVGCVVLDMAWRLTPPG